MAREINNINQEIERLKQNNQNLTALIESFNNQSFLEKEAKRRLNLRKEGEEVVILPKNEFSDNQTTTPETNSASLAGSSNQNQVVDNKEEPNFQKWWRYFFK